MLYLSAGQGNGAKTTNFVRDNLKFKQANQDAYLQNVAPVTTNPNDQQLSKKMINGKFGVAGMANAGAQRVLVAGGSGQVSSLP